MDHSEKSPSIPLFQRGKIQAPSAKRVHRQSPEEEAGALEEKYALALLRRR